MQKTSPAEDIKLPPNNNLFQRLMVCFLFLIVASPRIRAQDIDTQAPGSAQAPALKDSQQPTGSDATAPAAPPDGEKPAGSPGAQVPLPEEFAKALFEIESDPHPPSLAAGVHFPTSNEIRCFLWRESIQDRGGIFIGVGTDQNYLMAGWAKPDLLILMDFDQLVVDLHLIYRVAFNAASDPKQFVQLWSKKNASAFQALLEQGIAEPQTRKRIVEAFKAWRRTIELRMDFLLRHHKAERVKTFLDDPDQYQYLASLFKNNRVLAIRGDLTGQKTVRGIGQLAKLMNIPIRVLYLSNAERYFPYSDDYKQNILSLPFDDQSIILRTVGYGSWSNGDPFIYVYQSANNFLEWIKQPHIKHVTAVVVPRVAQKKKFLYSVVAQPPPPPPAKKEAKANPSKKSEFKTVPPQPVPNQGAKDTQAKGADAKLQPGSAD